MKHVTQLRQCVQHAASPQKHQLKKLGQCSRSVSQLQYPQHRSSSAASTSGTQSVPYASLWKGKERANDEFASIFSIPREHAQTSPAPSESIAKASRSSGPSIHPVSGSESALHLLSSTSSQDPTALPLLGLDSKTLFPKHKNTTRMLTAAPGDDRLARKILMAYPFLSHHQAIFMADVYDHLHQYGSEKCSTHIAWYESAVRDGARSATTTKDDPNGRLESVTAEEERISPESAVSLNLMLLFAYRRSDMKSVAVLEARARHYLLPVYPLPYDESKRRYELIGDLWPHATAEPLELAFNIKVALTAKFGLWDRVVSLLEDSRAQQHVMRSMTTTTSAELGNRRVEALNQLGWAELMRHGLGREALTPAQPSSSPTTRREDVPNLSARGWQLVYRQMREWRASNPGRIDADGGKSEIHQKKLCIERAALQDNALKFARQRLLSPLIKYTDREEASAGPSGEPQSTGAPHWMLQATLDNLSTNNDTAEVLRIARAALQEMRSLPPNVIGELYAKKSGVLNAVLKSVPAERKGGLDQILHLFHEFTGVDLRRCLISRTDKPQKQGKGSAGALFFTPSEASLCLVLKQVTHPYTRTGNCWKLYQQFRQDFPDVRLSSRTYRLLLMTTVSSAHLASPNVAATTLDVARDSRRSWQKKLSSTAPTLKSQALIRICEEIINYTATLSPRGPENHFHHFKRYLRNASYEDWRAFLHQCRKIQDLVRAIRARHDQHLATIHAETADILNRDTADQTAETLLEQKKARQKRVNTERHLSASTTKLDLCLTLLEQVQRLR